MNLPIPEIKGLKGTHSVPGDKSVSHRALMISAIAEGHSEILNCSGAADPMSTLSCIKQLGITYEEKNSCLKVDGKGKLGLRRSDNPLDAGNSGTTMRLLSGILAGQKFSSVLIGDSSLSGRPMKRIIDPLRLMGSHIHGTENDTAPLIIDPVGQLNPIRYDMPVQSAQVKSAVIFAGLYASGETTILENIKTRDHTERMLGLETGTEDGKNRISVNPGLEIRGKKFFVPGDISAAAFLIAAAMIKKGSGILIENVGLNPTRTKILDIFRSMNGDISIGNQRVVEGEPVGDIEVRSSELKGNIELKRNDVTDIIDEVPILTVVSMFAEGAFKISDAQELRKKETDRISALVKNLRLLGCDVEEHEDGFEFESRHGYSGNIIPSYNDHRIAMAFGVAGLRIRGITIENADCVDISFPNFWHSILKPA
jgi:3-phosphoshikimate 1-carboxyvinyltransferase